MKLFKIADLEDVLKILKEQKSEDICEEITIEESLGRILYEDILSDINIPHFDRSTVDGYAVHHKSVNGASEMMPIITKITEKIKMNSIPEKEIKTGESSYIPTGGMMPKGADSVVMMEYTEKLSENDVLIGKTVSPLENVNSTGEDIEKGELVLEAFRKIKAYDMGLLAALGIKNIKVLKKLKIGIISTGDEIIEYYEMPLPGQVRNSNSLSLYGMTERAGAVPYNFGIVKDDEEAVKKALNEALSKCDIVLISGGSSVGERDHTISAVESIPEAKVLVHGIAIKPGKPTIIARSGSKMIFGLPGNPFAVLVIFRTIIEKYINRFSEKEKFVTALFDTNYHKAMGRSEFLPVKLEERDDEVYALPLRVKSSSVAVLAKADGFVIIEKNKEGLYSGEKIKVYEL